MKSRVLFLVDIGLAVVGASLFIFLPYPRDEGEAWLALSGGAAAVVGLAWLFFHKWGWDDRGLNMVSLIFVGSFCLMIVGFFLLPDTLHRTWGLVTNGLMLICGGALAYGLLLAVRHVVKTISNPPY